MSRDHVTDAPRTKAYIALLNSGEKPMSGGVIFAMNGRQEISAQATLTGMFREWLELRSRISFEAGRANEPALADLLRRQNALFAKAISTPATAAEDVLFKLALWRWSKLPPDLDPSRLPPSDAVIFSALKDLAALLGRDAILVDHPGV